MRVQKSSELNEKSLTAAKAYVSATDSNLGGTDLLPCLRAVFAEARARPAPRPNVSAPRTPHVHR